MANRNSVYDEEDTGVAGDSEQLDRDFYKAIGDISVEEEKAMEKAAEEGAAEDMAEDGQPNDVKDFYDHVNNLSDDERKQFFANSEDPSTVRGRIGQQLRSNAKRRWVLGGIGATLLGAIGSFILSVLPFQLPFVANLFDMEVGGVRDVVLQSRTGRLYSRMFFFDQDGKFDGYKSRGMVATLTGKNIRSNRFINDMKSKGLEIDPQLDANGRWTGRFNSIAGVSTTIDNNTSFLQEWRQTRDARKAVRRFVRENYSPSVTGWRGRAIRTAYSRYGLNYFRGQFIKDYAGRRIDGLAEKVRFSKIRSRTADVDIRVNNDEIITEDGDPDTPEERQTFGGELGEQAAERRQQVLDGDVGSIIADLDNPEDIAEKTAKNTIGGVTRAVSIFGAIEGLCHVKKLMVGVEVGARTIKRLDLIEFAKMMGAMGHVVKPGDVPTAQDYGDFVIGMAKINPATGRDFFGSGAYGYASGTNDGTVVPYQQARYSTGGGALGALGGVNDIVNEGINTETCDFVNHPIIQVASIVGGVIAMAFSLGTFTASKAASQVGIEAAILAAEIVFVPMLVEMLAGTIITGDEFGDEIASAWLAGFGGLLVLGGGIYGMGSLTKDQYAVLNEEKERMIAEENKFRSFGDRFFSMTDHRSLLANISVSTHIAKTQGLGGTLGMILSNPLGSMYGSLGKLPFSKTFAAAGPSDQCKDEDIVNYDLAADPFCNPIMGLGVDTLAVDPVDNVAWMIDNGHADEDGNPLSDEFKEYTEQCVNVLDPLHSSASEFGYEFTPMCYAGVEIAEADGTVRPMTEEEIAMRKNYTPTMDDLYAYLGVEIEPEKGKAYAANAEETIEVFENPTLTQRFQAFTLDRSLLSDIEEHYNGVTNEELQAVQAPPIGGGSTGGGFNPGSGALPPGVPNRPCNNPITVTPSSNIRSLVEGSAPGTCLRFTNGTYTGISNLRPVANMVIEGESRDGVIINGGNQFENAFSGTNPDVTIRNMTFTNYNIGNTQEYAPIRGKDAVWGSSFASGWVIDSIHSHHNGAAGLFMGNNFFVVRSEFNNNDVTGIGGDRFEGGLVQGNSVHNNGAGAAQGAAENGGGMKFTVVKGTTTRLLIADNEVHDQENGIWCDWACNGINVENNRIYNHRSFGIFYELSRDAIFRGNTVTASSTWSNWTGAFANGCIASGESQDVLIENNTVSGCQGSIVIRETVRPHPGEGGVINSTILPTFIQVLGPQPFVGKNITVRGNTVNGGGVGHAVDTSALGRTQLSTVRFEGNTYNGVTWWWNQQHITTLSGWRAIHPGD